MISSSNSLAKLSRSSQIRLLKLRELAYQGGGSPFTVADRLLTYVVLQVQTEWAEFVRAFLISCVTGTSGANGNPVTVGLVAARRVPEMMRLATEIQSQGRKKSIPRNRRDEPSWHDIRMLLALATRIRLSNEANISAALSTGSTVFGTLTSVRNFYAHRNLDSKNTALSRLRGLPVPSYPHPTLLLLSTPAGSSSPLVVDWIEDLHVSIEIMCQ